MNSVTLLGRLTRDPELSHSNSGMAVVRFSLAVDRQLSREKRQEYEQRNQPTADFINVVCFGRLAETVGNFTAKGKRLLVQGRIQTGSFERQDGTRQYTTDVVASNVEFIDWKDRESSSYNSSSSYRDTNTNGRANSQMEEDYLGDDFEAIDNEPIPF